MLEAHKTVPSLLHGDLWTGNAGVTSDGEPVIFVGFRVWIFFLANSLLLIPLRDTTPVAGPGDVLWRPGS